MTAAVQCTCGSYECGPWPESNAQLLAEVKGLRSMVVEQYAETQELRTQATELNAKFDRVAEQVAGVVEQAGPVIEKLASSPMVRMLTGGGKRDK